MAAERETRDISARHSQMPLGRFKRLEDPFLLRLRDGSYHMIMHQVGAFSGAHAFSVDKSIG